MQVFTGNQKNHEITKSRNHMRDFSVMLLNHVPQTMHLYLIALSRLYTMLSYHLHRYSTQNIIHRLITLFSSFIFILAF